MKARRRWGGASSRRVVFMCLVFLAASMPVGTAWHEIVGHGLTGVLVGGRINYVEVYGVSLWPHVEWIGWGGYYGHCEVGGLQSVRDCEIQALGGSMSTWAVSVVACGLLWARRWHGWKLAALVSMSMWWVDLLTYTLPSWGFKRSILWGRVFSEPYEAAVALGMPGWVFQGFVVGSSAILLGLSGWRLWELWKSGAGRGS